MKHYLIGKSSIVILLAFIVLPICFASKASACYYLPPSFEQSWDEASLIIVGDVISRAEHPATDGKGRIALNEVKPNKTIKGDTNQIHPLIIATYFSHCGIGYFQGDSYVLFLKQYDQNSDMFYNLPASPTHRVVYSIAIDDHKSDVVDSVDSYKTYLGLLQEQDKANFLIEQLRESNSLSIEFFVYEEVKKYKIEAAIPYLIARIDSGSEHDRLATISLLGSLEYTEENRVLGLWLNDERFKFKSGVVDKIIESNDRVLIPDLLKCLATCEDPHRIGAARALLHFGDKRGKAVLFHIALHGNDIQIRRDAVREIAPFSSGYFAELIDFANLQPLLHNSDDLIRVDSAQLILSRFSTMAKAVLFDVILTSSDKIARYNAIHNLHWNYTGSFSKTEIGMLRTMMTDVDESISRVAGLIIELSGE